MVATLATALPLMVPSMPLANTATLAGPPGEPPAMAIASELKNFAMPVSDKKAPNNMNR